MGGKSYKRQKTKYPGVFYRVGKRIGGKGQEKIFYVVFKRTDKQGKTKLIEEKVGRQFSDEMTATKAATIRGELIEGKRLTRKEQRVQREAEEARRKAEAERPTIKKMWAVYIDREDKPIKGLAQDRSRFKRYLEPVVGDKEPSEITELDTQKIANSLKNLALQTKAHVWRLLRRIVRAEAGEEVWKVIFKGARIDKRMPKKIHNEVEHLLTDEMLARYLAAVEADHDPVVRSVVKLAMFTGMRRGEILKLRWRDIDLRTGFVLLPDPKSGTPEKVPLSPHAMAVIRGVERGESDLLFPGKQGNVRPDIKRGLARVKERAGLPPEYRPLHDLRHNYATCLANSGQVDLYLLQKLLCHKDPSTTMRYAHLIDQARKNAAALAGDLFDQAVKNGNAVLNGEAGDDKTETA